MRVDPPRESDTPASAPTFAAARSGTSFHADFSRSGRLLGPDALDRLSSAHVLLFGVGGVGSYCAEALIRSGIGKLSMVDPDLVHPSNINRQLPALASTMGRLKVEAMAARLRDINPSAELNLLPLFFDHASASRIDFNAVDYVVDAIDSVPGKILLMELCRTYKRPLIASMGAGNKTDPSRFRIRDLSKTSVCPLARIMRREAKKRGLRNVQVVFSDEEVIPAELQFDLPSQDPQDPEEARLSAAYRRRRSPGSLPFVPAAAGLLMASRVCMDLARSEAGLHIPH